MGIDAYGHLIYGVPLEREDGLDVADNADVERIVEKYGCELGIYGYDGDWKYLVLKDISAAHDDDEPKALGPLLPDVPQNEIAAVLECAELLGLKYQPPQWYLMCYMS